MPDSKEVLTFITTDELMNELLSRSSSCVIGFISRESEKEWNYRIKYMGQVGNCYLLCDVIRDGVKSEFIRQLEKITLPDEDKIR